MLEYRKVVFTDVNKVELQKDTLDDQNVPAGHALLKNHYTLISTGTELACLAGYEGWFQMPAVPGYISVGEIVKLGEDTEGCAVGDVIYYFGGHSEYSIWPVKGGCFMRVPEEIEEKYVPLVRTATMAATAIRVSEIEWGDYVAVTGQGMMGIMAAQIAHLQGATAIGIDHHDSRLEIAKKCNVDYALNSAKCDVKEEITKITNGNMINCAIEAIGNTQVLIDNIDLLAKDGEAIILGTPRTTCNTDASPIFTKVFLGDFDVKFKGAHEWSIPYEKDTFVKHSIMRNTEIAFDFMKSGRLEYKSLLTHVVKPEECADIYAELKTNKDDYMGVVFDWR